MEGLCSVSNTTLISIDSPFERVIFVKSKEKKVVGLIGKCIDDMLGKIEDRKCELIGTELLGAKLDNGTYTGALGLLQSGKGHLYLKGEPNFIDEEWLQQSLPLRAENIWASQVIEDENKFNYFDLLENFKFSLAIYSSYFFVLLIFGLSCFYLIKANLNKNRNYLRLTNRLKFVYFISYLFISRKFKFKFILLFLGLFSWFTILFLTNTIKTNKVVVDTSELIKDTDALMKSEISCFIKDETAYNLALNSNKNSLLSRLLNDKTKFKNDQYEKSILKSDRCLISHTFENVESIKRNSLICSQIETLAILILMPSIAKKIFLLTKGIQEYNAVVYGLKYKSSQFPNLKFKEYWNLFDKIQYAGTEKGTSIKLYNCMESNAQSAFSNTMKVYKEVYEYIEDNTGSFANFELNNFSSLFIIYFGFLAIIFIIFLFFEILPFYYFKFIDKFYQFINRLTLNFYLYLNHYLYYFLYF